MEFQTLEIQIVIVTSDEKNTAVTVQPTNS